MKSKNAKKSNTHIARAYHHSICILEANKDAYTTMLAFLLFLKNAKPAGK
jgi:hypothetical protein